MIREDLTEFRYYLEALSKFMQESYGISEQVKTFWSLLKQVDDYYDEYLRELDFFEVNRKPGETSWNVEGETLDKIGAIFGCQRKFTIPVYDTANMFNIVDYAQIDMNDDEFLVYIKTQVIKQNFDGTRETLQRLYSTFVDGKIQEGLIPQRFLYTTEYAPDGAICTIRWDEESPSQTLAKLFDNGYLTIESMGIRYRRQITNFNDLAYYAKNEYRLLASPSAPSDWGDVDKYFSISEIGPASQSWDPFGVYAKKINGVYVVCPNEPTNWANVYQDFIKIEITAISPLETYSPNTYYQYSDSLYSRYASTELSLLSTQPSDWSEGGYYKDLGAATSSWDDDKIYAKLHEKEIIGFEPESFLGMTAVPAGALVKAYLDGFKGNSAVVNQLVQLKNDTVSPAGYPISSSTTTHKITFSGTATSTDANTIGVLDHNITFQSGHTYLISFKISGTIPSVRLGNFSNITGNATTTSTDIFVTAPSDATDVRLIASSVNGTAYSGDLIIQCVDCTIVPLTSAEMASVSAAKAALKHKDIDLDSYIPHNAGTLTDSKPTKLYSRNAILKNVSLKSITTIALNTLGFYTIGTNRWQVSLAAQGAKKNSASSEMPNIYCSKYTALSPNDWEGAGDKTMTLTIDGFLRIRDSSITQASDFSGTLFYELNTPSSTISQAVIDGLVEHEYDLTLPTLKSAGSVQDESKAGGSKIGTLNLGTPNWEKEGTSGVFAVHLTYIKQAPNYNTKGNLLCDSYVTAPPSSSEDKVIRINDITSYSYLRIKDSTYAESTAAQFKTAMNGKMLNYEKTDYTDFTDMISYPEIFNVYAGGCVEIVGEGCDATTMIKWVKRQTISVYAITAHQPTNWSTDYSSHRVFELTDGSETFATNTYYAPKKIGGRYA